MAEVSGWGTLDRAKERDGSGQVRPEEGPEDSLVLGLETLASLSLGGSGREQAAQASDPGVLTTGGCQGPQAGDISVHSPPSLFWQQELDMDWDTCPFSLPPLPLSSLPTEAPGHEGLRPFPAVGA